MKGSFNITRFRGLLINIFLVFLSLSFCLFALEIILRVTTEPVTKTIKVISEGVRIRDLGLNANSHKIIRNTEGIKIEYITNADGLRDNDYNIDKSRDTFRIIGLGDSFTYGLGVSLEDSYLKVLEKLLNEDTLGKYRFEVLNLGVSGIGQKQMLELLTEVAMKYHPDLVSLAFYVGNDLSDNMKYIKGKDIEKVKQKGSLNFPFKKFLKKHSRAIAFSAQKWSNFCFSVGINKYEKKKLFMKKYPEDIEEAFELTENLIVEISDLLKTYNIELCVIVIPMEFQVDFNLQDKGKYTDANSIIIDKPQTTIRKILNKNSINHIDLLRRFREEKERKGKDLYLKNFRHWNSAGHYLAAEEIFRHLVAEQLIPVSIKNQEE